MSDGDDRFASLYRAHYRHVYAYCRRRVSADQADDLVADVLLAVWRRIDDAPSGDQALPWLYRIAHLTASNHWRGIRRKRNLQKKLDSIGEMPPEPLADQIVNRQEVRDALSVLDGLGPADREIIQLSVWENLTNEQIALVLDLTPEATRQRLHRAKKRLTSSYVKQYSNKTSPAAQEGGGR